MGKWAGRYTKRLIKSYKYRALKDFSGGGGGIRTPGTLASSTVFKTAAFNRSATPPQRLLFVGTRDVSQVPLMRPKVVNRVLTGDAGLSDRFDRVATPPW